MTASTSRQVVAIAESLFYSHIPVPYPPCIGTLHVLAIRSWSSANMGGTRIIKLGLLPANDMVGTHTFGASRVHEYMAILESKILGSSSR